MDCIIVSPKICIGETRIPNGMVLGGGASEKSFGLDEVRRWSLHDGIGGLIRRGKDQSFLSQSCEDTARRWQNTSQEVGFDQIRDLQASWSWAFQPPELWEVKTYCLSASFYGYLLQQHELRHTFSIQNWVYIIHLQTISIQASHISSAQ